MSFERVELDGGRIVLYRGDCLEVMPTLEGVDAVVTDPPYGVGLEAKRAKQRGGGVVSRTGEYSHDDTPEYVRQVAVPAVELSRKVGKSVAVTPGIRCMWMYPKPDDIGCFFSAASTGMGRWGFSCMQPILYYGKDPYLANSLGSRANSCGQVYPNDANKQNHPCAKPICMMLWLVQRASLARFNICDPFMGSGTTGVACVRLNRRFIGIEIDPGYFETARKRIQKELDLRDGSGPLMRAGKKGLFEVTA